MPISGSYYYPVMQKPTTSLDGGRMSVSGEAEVGILDVSGSVTISGTLDVPSLPTSDPHNTGSLWNDSGTVKVSGY